MKNQPVVNIVHTRILWPYPRCYIAPFQLSEWRQILGNARIMLSHFFGGMARKSLGRHICIADMDPDYVYSSKRDYFAHVRVISLFFWWKVFFWFVTQNRTSVYHMQLCAGILSQTAHFHSLFHKPSSYHENSTFSDYIWPYYHVVALDISTEFHR